MNLKTLALVVPALALLVGGCAPNRMPLEIQAVCYPTESCAFSATCDAQLIGSLTHYTSSGSWLWIPAQVANLLADNGDPSTGRVNTNDAHVTGFEVDFSGAATGTAVLDWGNQWVPADGTSVISIYVPTPAGTTGYVYADIRLVGYYDNGNDFVTGDFHLSYAADGVGSFSCPAATPLETCPGTGTQSPAFCAAPASTTTP